MALINTIQTFNCFNSKDPIWWLQTHYWKMCYWWTKLLELFSREKFATFTKWEKQTSRWDPYLLEFLFFTNLTLHGFKHLSSLEKEKPEWTTNSYQVSQKTYMLRGARELWKLPILSCGRLIFLKINPLWMEIQSQRVYWTSCGGKTSNLQCPELSF